MESSSPDRFTAVSRVHGILRTDREFTTTSPEDSVKRLRIIANENGSALARCLESCRDALWRHSIPEFRRLRRRTAYYQGGTPRWAELAVFRKPRTSERHDPMGAGSALSSRVVRPSLEQIRSQELEGVPESSGSRHPAFVEGWGLYARVSAKNRDCTRSDAKSARLLTKWRAVRAGGRSECTRWVDASASYRLFREKHGRG